MKALLIWLARQCRLFGWRGASVVLLELGSVVSAQRSVAFQLVIDLLVLGRVERARRKVLAARSIPMISRHSRVKIIGFWLTWIGVIFLIDWGKIWWIPGSILFLV